MARLEYLKDYGPCPWLPPTKTDAAIDRGTSAALNVLILMLFAFNLWARVALAASYVVVPPGMTVASYYTQLEAERAPWEDAVPEHTVVTADQFERRMQERTAWMRWPNAFGVTGMLAYIGLRLSQPWYRARARRKFALLLNKKGGLSD